MSESAPQHPFCSRHRRAKAPGELSPRLRRHVEWYRRERAKWIAHLGGKCARCGATDELEFHHSKPRDWEPRRTSRWQRLRNYIKDIKAGLVASLLCRRCNASEGYPGGQMELIEARERAKDTPF